MSIISSFSQHSLRRSYDRQHEQVAGWHVHQVSPLFPVQQVNCLQQSGHVLLLTYHYWVWLFLWLGGCNPLVRRRSGRFHGRNELSLRHRKLLRTWLSFQTSGYSLVHKTFILHFKSDYNKLLKKCIDPFFGRGFLKFYSNYLTI